MKTDKDHKAWIKAVSTPEKAAEWDKETDKWVYVYESLNEVGNTYSLTNNPGAINYLVDKVEAYYEEVEKGDK